MKSNWSEIFHLKHEWGFAELIDPFTVEVISARIENRRTCGLQQKIGTIILTSRDLA